MSEDSGSSELRLLLLGNIGCGKTSSADTILSVVSPVSPSASRKSQLRRGAAEGRGLTLVEAPRWYWNGGKMEDSVRTETQRAATLVSPGPHAVLLLVPVSQFTEMEARVPAELEEAFGSEVLDHTLVLLTCGDYLMGRTVEEYLRKEHPGLRQIIDRCGGRYHVINNRQRQDRDQVQQLLEKVDSLVAMNGVYYMKSSEERDLERRVSDRKKELMENYRAQKEKRETSSSSSPETLRSIDYTSSSSTSYTPETRRSIDYSNTSSSTSYTTPETRRSIDYTSTSFTPETRRSVDYSSSSTTSSNPETRRSIDYSSSSTSNSSTTPDLRRINDYSSTSSSSPSYTMDTRRSNDYSSTSPTSEMRRSIDYSNTSSSSTSYTMDTRRSNDYSTSSPTPETRRSIDYSSTSFTNPETRRINDYSTSSSSTSYTTPETRSSIDYSSTSSPTLETRRSITSFTPETRRSLDYSSSSTNPDLRRINDYSSTTSFTPETRRSNDYSTSSSSTSYTTPETRRSNDYSSSSTNPDLRRITDYSTSSSTVETRRRSWREEAEEESVGGGQTSNGVHSAQSESTRSPSFRLNAVHQRMNSVEDRSPGMSPPSTPHSPVFFSSSSPSSSSSPELRLVLLGRSGSGKSAVGNQILGREAFESHQDSLTAVTQECEKKKAFVEGRQVAVVDTPDWFNSERTPDEVRAQISSCVALSSPGPHAFLMCVPLDQPAKTELQGLGALESVFGPDSVQRRTLLIFTFADKLKQSGKTGDGGVESYIAAHRPDLLKLVEKCGDRFHVMETGGGGGAGGGGGGGGVLNRRNVSDLLEKVEQTVKEGGGNFYSHPAFQEAEDRVRQRQVEIARDRKMGNSQHLYSYMQPVEEVNEDELERTRDEAELSVRSMNIESLPPITRSTMNPSMLQSLMEKMEISAKMFPKFLSDSSVWVGEGAKKVKDSPVWGKMGSGAQNVHKMVVDSSVWGKVGSGAKVVGDKVGTGAGHVSKLVGPRVPKVVVDGSAWVGSGAKSVAASPVWGKVGSGAKTGASLVADGSMRLGAGAKTLAQSPVWGKVGSGAKSGAKLMAENSVKVGAGIGAGAKKVAQSPVWGKMGSGAKAGAKKVAESPVWEKIGAAVKKIPKMVIGGALLGLVLGVVLGGALGGAIGATVGSAVSEVGRRKLGNKTASEKTENAVRAAERNVNDGIESVRRQGEKLLKTE